MPSRLSFITSLEVLSTFPLLFDLSLSIAILSAQLYDFVKLSGKATCSYCLTVQVKILTTKQKHLTRFADKYCALNLNPLMIIACFVVSLPLFLTLTFSISFRNAFFTRNCFAFRLHFHLLIYFQNIYFFNLF